MYIIVCMYNIIYIYIIPRVLHVMVSLPKKLGDLATIDVISWGLNPVIDQVILVNWWYTRLALFFVFTKDSIKQPPFGDVYTCMYIYIYTHNIYIYTHNIYIYIYLFIHILYIYIYIYICPPPFPFMGILLVALKTLFFTPAKSAQLFVEEVHGWVWLKPIGPKNGGLIQKKIYPLVN